MSSKPLVSIIIPCYNDQRWIARCITSAIDQTWSRTEIIVVDDGSTDESLTVARRFERNGVQVLTQQNLGASAARNVGFRCSTGDFIQYLDSDDLLAPSKIEIQVTRLLKSNSNRSIASGKWLKLYESGVTGESEHRSLFEDLDPVEWLVRAWELPGMMQPAAWLVPRGVLEQAGDWNEGLSLNDDGEFFARVLLVSSQILYCPEAISFYRSGGSDRLSASQTPQAWESLYRSFELTATALLAVRDDERTRQACADTFQRFIYLTYPDGKSLRSKAQRMVEEMGGSDTLPLGGPRFQLFARLFGWKAARRTQRIQGWYRKKLSERRSKCHS